MMKILLVIGLVLIAAFTLQGCTGSNNWAVPGAASNLSPTAVITSPLAGSISDEGLNVTFTGAGQDTEDGALSGASLVWTSDIDGQIGTGLTFGITTLSRGVHVITLTATDGSGGQGKASITITVRTPWLVDTSWGYRQQITISASMASLDQTDFPVLIKITDQTNPLFGRALSNGDDILFTDMDGVNQLDHEIELYTDTGTEELVAWVRIPNLSSSSDTILYMYYGYLGAGNQENADAVWDSNYLGVWHLSEDPDPAAATDCAGGAGTKEVCDSTLNNVDGDSNGGMTSGDQVAGQVNGSLDFDGSNDYINLGNTINLTDNITVEAWFNTRTIPPPPTTDARWRTIVGDRWEWQLEITGDVFFGAPKVIFRRWGPYRGVLSSTDLSTDQWYYAAVTVSTNNPWDFNNKNLKMYINGLFDAEGPLQTPININLASTLRISGRINIDIDWFDGLIDEVRISDTVRSAEWIEATYNNLDKPDVYLTFQTEEGF